MVVLGGIGVEVSGSVEGVAVIVGADVGLAVAVGAITVGVSSDDCGGGT